MQKTDVYLLVPEYAGMSGTIQAAYDLATNVDPDGPIQFHLVDYPEPDPKEYLAKDDEWDATSDITPSERFQIDTDYSSISVMEQSDMYYRNYLDVPETLLTRMDRAEEWFFQNKQADPANSLVILLNTFGNTHNYFCGPSPSSSNVAFIQTTHYATEVTTARHIPVAYEFFASALRFRAFNVPDYQERFVHFDDIGCLNDFFEDISKIQLKIQSANVCDDCYKRILNQKVEVEFLDHLYAGLNTIRETQVNFTRARRANKPLTVTVRNKYLLFEENTIQIKLTPRQMALYRFYLNHPEGVNFKDFKNHEEELTRIYSECYTGDVDDAEENISSVIEKWLLQEDISSPISKLNKELKSALRELAHWHTIEGPRGEAKCIKALNY